MSATLFEARPAPHPQGWAPEDPAFWSRTGRRVARRNLICSMLVEHLSFNVWTLWSVVAVSLADRHFSVDELFWLVSLPSLVGALLRIPYTFAPARFGGRTWTTVSALLLLLPATLLTVAARDPHAPYWLFLSAAALAGLGGANFASSMANIAPFFPRRRQGVALGLNAASGNLGVSSVQVLVPLLIGGLGLAAAGWVWIPLALLAALGAHVFMDNLEVPKPVVRERMRVCRSVDTWVVSLLYVGTFGSFIGFATALPLLTAVQFPDMGRPWYLLLGPLVGAGMRPVGGWLADHRTGAGVTRLSFLAMAVGAAGALLAARTHGFPLFLLSFLVLFAAAGVGNGSIYRMIPAIFDRDAAAVVGVTAAVGALGGFLVNRGFGASIAHTGFTGTAFAVLAGFYGLCFAVTWCRYGR